MAVSGMNSSEDEDEGDEVSAEDWNFHEENTTHSSQDSNYTDECEYSETSSSGESRI